MTRPREHAPGLARLIEAAGGRAFLFPAIEIVDLPGCPALSHLDDYDIVIFVSPTAVQRAGTALPRKAMAIGAGTRRELERRGVGALAPAEGADSEALLALPQLRDVAGRRVAIVRGQGGREMLGDTLSRRGAKVDYAECYRRVRPSADPAPLLEAVAQGAVHAVTVSSAEGVDNFLAMLGGAGHRLCDALPWFAAHPRIAEHASRCGVARVVVAGPGDDEMLERLVAYFDAP